MLRLVSYGSVPSGQSRACKSLARAGHLVTVTIVEWRGRIPGLGHQGNFVVAFHSAGLSCSRHPAPGAIEDLSKKLRTQWSAFTALGRMAVPLTSQMPLAAAWIRQIPNRGFHRVEVGACLLLGRAGNISVTLTHRISLQWTCNAQSQPRPAPVCLALYSVIGFCAPVIEEMNARALRIRIPLGWRTRNHLEQHVFRGVRRQRRNLVRGLRI